MGPGVSYDTILFTKIIRICIAFLETHKLSVVTISEQQPNGKENTPPPSSGRSTPNTFTRENPQTTNETKAEILSRLTPNELAFYNQIYSMLNDILMPSLSMIQMNPCLAVELWNLLKMFPYEMRLVLEIYQDHKST